MSFMFENLEVYQRAVDLVQKIAALTQSFPAKGYHYLIDQLRRASLSIPLNIAEGNGRWHVGDRKNFFWIARGSVSECVPLLELCKREKLITEETWIELKSELEVLSKMLTALVKGTDKRAQQNNGSVDRILCILHCSNVECSNALNFSASGGKIWWSQ